ncbi:aspartate aminotransferase family protein [Evansella tamaricis]|uniref:Acetylornithine aminotransferase n=1 Tax=Evansella tamaricis TaxID=2069301 RepID=A0ABS6JK18_9BACI|nr:aspartate aminotransferase family protein [Evansella tamaricis]MBU9714029.1 aspartate aminotransferase family protein [Evansella tamaricis]
MPETVNQWNPIMGTYQRYPLTLVKGKGSYVWDDKGKKYLDFTSGIATCNLGHVPDAVKKAVASQLEDLWHCSNLYDIPAQQKLAGKIVEHSFGDQVFFCNSGAEANEGAIKLARRYAQKVKGTNAFEIVTFQKSFHGRTLATLSATGQAKIQDGFSPLVGGFRYLPYNDFEALEHLVHSETCAVLLELVQGEGGVVSADYEWLINLSDLCKEKEILFMVDEVQTGIGRTGKLFAYENYGVEPDVMTIAKGLGSGIPIGALVAKGHVAAAFEAGTHGSTFGGNPIASTAGFETLNYLLTKGVLEAAKGLGEYLGQRLWDLLRRFPKQIKEVRGLGLLRGLYINGEAKDIITKARGKQVLLLPAGPDVVRILPPLTATVQEVDVLIGVLEEILAEGVELQ